MGKTKDCTTKKRSAYQYCVLQYWGNIVKAEYDEAIAVYEAKIEDLKALIEKEELDKVPEHFLHQELKWIKGNRIELLRRVSPKLFERVEQTPAPLQ